MYREQDLSSQGLQWKLYEKLIGILIKTNLEVFKVIYIN